MIITSRPISSRSVFSPVTITGFTCNLSTVNGTAFITNPSTSLVSYLGRKITLTDSGISIVGWIKEAPGAAETLNTNLITNGADFTGGPPPTGWTEGRGTLAAVAGGQAGNCLELTKVDVPSQFGQWQQTGEIGALYKFSGYVKSGTSGNEAYNVVFRDRVAASFVITLSGTSSASWVQVSGYGTATVTATGFYFYKMTTTAGTMLFDTAVLQKVLTPSATGCTIVSAPGGTTYNWASQGSSFNSNATSFTAVITSY